MRGHRLNRPVAVQEDVKNIPRPAHPLDADYLLVKHYPGGQDHDQKTHGHGGGATVTAERNELKGFPARDSVRYAREEVNTPKKWAKSITADEQNTINYYTENGVTLVNNHLKGKAGFADPGATEAHIRNMDAMIARAGEQPEMIVYRGISGLPLVNMGEDSPDVARFRALRERFENNVGNTITLPGYQSTTTDSTVAVDFSGRRDRYPEWKIKDEPMVYEIRTRRGAPVGNLSKHPKEREFILGHNWKYRVMEVNRGTKFKSRDGKIRTRTVVRLEVV